MLPFCTYVASYSTEHKSQVKELFACFENIFIFLCVCDYVEKFKGKAKERWMFPKVRVILFTLSSKRRKQELLTESELFLIPSNFILPLTSSEPTTIMNLVCIVPGIFHIYSWIIFVLFLECVFKFLHMTT